MERLEFQVDEITKAKRIGARVRGNRKFKKKIKDRGKTD